MVLALLRCLGQQPGALEASGPYLLRSECDLFIDRAGSRDFPESVISIWLNKKGSSLRNTARLLGLPQGSADLRKAFDVARNDFQQASKTGLAQGAEEAAGCSNATP